ncbi:MAG: protein translocase subunit SecD [Candidatus Portnoybacteria bacterium CG11_big_fil_rev_8_21_14_0_20_40_15]|uniref:Protein translocase subunit SecD n=1 Tax=Candidatus Portnoybacteria bacterium CG11_big_fil_rev_8_21_14_0_20_40_15 TaxID=1974817 RepID=A0A2H0KSE3_9BACT|nr:MAG: protein translocase subunit SecD [Candidatus Portnoybacteria bacterium CG11_big_fil_rev_8_21_14_0_20_40_15]
MRLIDLFIKREAPERGASFLRQGKVSRLFWIVLAIILLAFFAGFLDYPKAWNKGVDWLNAKKNEVGFLQSLPSIPQFFNLPFRLGLDLLGGTHLVYEADLSQISNGNINDAMQGVRDVIERRVNAFGIAEPVVQIDTVGQHHRLIVELAGIRDIDQAIKMIGETPFLEFKEEMTTAERDQILSQSLDKDTLDKVKDVICSNPNVLIPYLRGYGAANDPCYKPTGLNGKYLTGAQINYDQTTYRPLVFLQFNDEGAKLFEDITRRNVGKKVAIYLDGEPISIPTVQDVISGGKAQITGSFTEQEVKTLAQRLNAGALPVPIKLISQETIGASLGEKSLNTSLIAGLIGLAAVILFMIFWYRLPGLVATIALLIYTAVVLAIFKLFSVTLTLAGIAGFILSIGMAVDANILIFARMREELNWGKSLGGAIDEGFKRAWTSIRDSNISSLITCLILFWLGTSIIKGFALTLAIGILVSMFSAITVTRIFLKAIMTERLHNYVWLFGGKKQRSE